MSDLPDALQFTNIGEVLALPSVPDDEWRLLPAEPGLYFAVVNFGEVAYIGISQRNLRGRWIDHEQQRDGQAVVFMGHTKHIPRPH